MKHEDLPHYWINHLGFLLRKRLVQEFAKHNQDVSAEEWAILLILQSAEGLSATELSDRTFRDKTTLTRMVDKLVRKQLVIRNPDANDRRVVRLSLTAQGKSQFETLAAIARPLIEQSLEDIAAPDLAITVATLTQMVENLKPQRGPDDDL